MLALWSFCHFFFYNFFPGIVLNRKLRFKMILLFSNYWHPGLAMHKQYLKVIVKKLPIENRRTNALYKYFNGTNQNRTIITKCIFPQNQGFIITGTPAFLRSARITTCSPYTTTLKRRCQVSLYTLALTPNMPLLYLTKT